jgi:hypothetical protein
MTEENEASPPKAKHCKDCYSKPPAPGKCRCEGCAVIHNSKEAQRRELRRSNGECVVCGKPAVPSDDERSRTGQRERGRGRGKRSLCKKHQKAYAKYAERQRQRRKANGHAVPKELTQ